MGKLPPKTRFTPKNKNKYLGNYNNIIARSGWERQVMIYLDNNPNILKWSSERISIPYYNPITEKTHRYYPDFWIKYLTNKNEIKECIIEIKPHHKTYLRERAKKITKAEFIVNKAKFEAAIKYCVNKGIEFKVITEKDVNFLK